MSDESGIQQFRLFGEDAPGWLVWGLALLGMVGFVGTATLSLPLLEQEYLSHFFGKYAIRDGNQGQSHPIPPSGTPVIADSAPKELVQAPDKSTAEDSVSVSVGIAESEPDAKASKMTADSSLEASGRDSPVPRDSSFASEVLSEPLGPAPDLLAGLRLPRPILDTSPSEEHLDDSLGSDSEHDREVVPEPTTSSQPPSGNGVEPETETLVARDTAPAAENTVEKVAAAAALPGHADTGVKDCAPLFLVSFSSGGVNPMVADLSSKAERLADWLRKHPTARVYLEGHTDGVGHEEFNLVLSHRRAKAVADILVQAGVPEAQLATRAYGESMFVDPGPRSGRNRRVSMRTIEGNECIPAVGDHDG